MSNLVNVTLVTRGIRTVFQNVSPQKAYKLVNNFSKSIGNGRLRNASQEDYVSYIECTNDLLINLSKDQQSFAIIESANNC